MALIDMDMGVPTKIENPTILLGSNLSGDQTIDITNDIPYYAELTDANFVITMKGNGVTASANDRTTTAIRYHDITTGTISYSNGIVSITAPIVRTNGRSYDTHITNISYNLYLMRSIGGV